MLARVAFHHVSPHRRHGTETGIRKLNISSSGLKYLQAKETRHEGKLHTKSFSVKFM